jgi:hypothetical protein
VNVVEGNLADLGRGRLPNHYREMGLASEWRFSRGRVLRRGVTAVVVVAAAGVLVGWLLSRD